MRYILRKIPENLPKQISKLYKKYLREDNKKDSANNSIIPFVSVFTYYVWFRQNKHTSIENLAKTFVYDKVFPIIVRLANDLVYNRFMEELNKNLSTTTVNEVLEGENIIKQYAIELTSLVQTQYGHYTECGYDECSMISFVTLLLLFYLKPIPKKNVLSWSINKNIIDPDYQLKIDHATLQCEIHKLLINALYDVLKWNRNEFIIFINHLSERLY